jgi:aminoglycoside phosphotransferase (APT) family kinase protein
MENIARTTRHLRARLEAEGVRDIGRRALTLVPAREGGAYHRDDEGNYWRAYIFVENATTCDIVRDPKQAREAARAFGRFLALLADLPPPRLHETIPDFHHTRSRFDALVKAVNADAHARADSARDLIGFALQREPMVNVLLDLQANGELPERITHNDTKVNNVLMDDETSEGLCVIDLDTVMPGLALYDFGDLVRSATNTAAEDERDLSRVSSNPDLFRALVEGYLSSARDLLTPAEIEHLPFSGKLMTFEVGLRFLADYLSGDVYFKTHRKGQNLDRCRAQFKLVRSIEEQEAAMMRMVRSA